MYEVDHPLRMTVALVTQEGRSLTEPSSSTICSSAGFCDSAHAVPWRTAIIPAMSMFFSAGPTGVAGVNFGDTHPSVLGTPNGFPPGGLTDVKHPVRQLLAT